MTQANCFVLIEGKCGSSLCLIHQNVVTLVAQQQQQQQQQQQRQQPAIRPSAADDCAQLQAIAVSVFHGMPKVVVQAKNDNLLTNETRQRCR